MRNSKSGALAPLTICVLVSLVVVACAPPSTTPTPTSTTTAPRATTPATTATPTSAVATPQAPAPTPTRAALPTAPTATRAPATPTPAGVQPQYGGILRIIGRGEPGNHDPHMSNTPHAYTGYDTEALLELDAVTGDPAPSLVESWEYKDQTTLIFKVRQGVKFHNLPPVNGREMTADDVVYSINRARTPSVANFPYSSRWVLLESLRALDRYTIELKLKGPSAAFLRIIPGTGPGAVLPKEAIEKFGDFRDPNNHIGTGAFIAGKYTPGVGGTMKRNPDYWQKGKPYLDGVDYTHITDDATIMAAWRTGRIDYGTNLTGGFTSEAPKRDLQRTHPQIEVFSAPNNYVTMLMPNLSTPPFNDLRVRKAIHLAMDRQEALTVVMGGTDAGHISGPMSWKIFPGWTYSEEELLKMPGFRQPKDQDIAEAKRLLAEAGFSKGLKIAAEGSEYSGFLNLRPTENAASQLKKIGIEITIKLVDRVEYFDQERVGKFTFRSRGVGTSLEPGDTMTTRHHSKGSRNFQQYSNPKFDALMDEQAVMLDVQKRKLLFRQAQDILMEELPQIWLFTSEGFHVRQPWVKGFTPTIYKGIVPEDVWIDQSKKR